MGVFCCVYVCVHSCLIRTERGCAACSLRDIALRVAAFVLLAFLVLVGCTNVAALPGITAEVGADVHYVLLMAGIIFFRLSFAIIVGYVIYLCLTDQAALLNSLLSLPIFYPIAALSYTSFLFSFLPLVYLTLHFAHLATAEEGNSFTVYFAVVYALSVPASLLLGLVVSLLIERPLLRFQQRVYTPSIDEDFSSPFFSYGSTRS